MDALKNEVYTGTVTKIGTKGTSNGGSGKFTVELMLDRDIHMLPGMNASASITLYTTVDVRTIPVAALDEKGSETIVYTGYNEDSGELVNPVIVTLGTSDGINAQIPAGLHAGETHSYFDTLEPPTGVQK